MGIVARQSIKGTIATYIGVAVGIVTTFFIQTKALQAEQIGLIDILLQCSLLFAGLAQLGTNSSAMRYYPFFKDEEHRDHGFFGWTLLVPLVGFSFFLLAFFCFKGASVDFFTKDAEVGASLFLRRIVICCCVLCCPSLSERWGCAWVHWPFTFCIFIRLLTLIVSSFRFV